MCFTCPSPRSSSSLVSGLNNIGIGTLKDVSMYMFTCVYCIGVKTAYFSHFCKLLFTYVVHEKNTCTIHILSIQIYAA